MKLLYPYYVKAFVKCSQSAIENRESYKTISPFALLLSDKANELVRRAELNSSIDCPKLQKEIFELGSEYIRQFADTARMKNKMGANGWVLETSCL